LKGAKNRFGLKVFRFFVLGYARARETSFTAFHCLIYCIFAECREEMAGKEEKNKPATITDVSAKAVVAHCSILVRSKQ
jgi:hypothetical protein